MPVAVLLSLSYREALASAAAPTMVFRWPRHRDGMQAVAENQIHKELSPHTC